MTRIKCFILILALISTDTLQPIPVSAAENQSTLPEIKVLATRTNAKNTEASAITVITQEEIREKNHFQVLEILREQVGISAVQTGAFGGNSSVFMRGANSDATLVMIDGVQANSNTLGAFNFSDLNLDNVERIEILRGAQSTLWGSDAVGGVINIVTKKGTGQEPEHFVGVEGGTFGTTKVKVGSAGDLDILDYSFSVSRTDSEGFSTVNERRGAIENDDYENTTVSTRVGKNFLSDGRIDFIGRYTQSANDFDNSFAIADNNSSSQTDQWYLAVPVEKQLTDWWHARLNMNYGQNEINTRSAFPSFIVSRSYTADLQNNFNINDNFSVVAGFEHQTTNAQNFSNGLKGENHAQGYYTQLNFNYDDRLFLSAGFRQTINSIYDDALTYKFEGAYKLNKYGTKIRGAYATAFRVPTFNQLFFPGFGNPNLVPEDTDSWEVGLRQEFLDGRIVIDTTYFDADYDNLIIAQFLNGMFGAFQVDRATAEGFETTGSFQIHETFRVSATHTYVDTQDINTRSQLPRRPENIYTVNLHWTPWDCFSALFGVHTRGSAFSSFPARRRVNGNSVGRIALSLKPMKNLEFTARIENIWDEDYEVAVPFGTPGRSGFVGMNFRFN